MKEKILTDQLVSNLEIVFKARLLAKKPQEIKIGYNSTNETSLSILYHLTIPEHLKVFANLLNEGMKQNIIELSIDNTIESYYKQVSQNKIQIEDSLKKIIENPNLIFYNEITQTTILLIEQLEQLLKTIDEDTSSLKTCYDALIGI